MKKTISSLGEFGFIDVVKKTFQTKISDKNIIKNIGDDCFVFNAKNQNIFISKDVLIEDVHFKKNWISPYNLGKKAVEVNVSDIASMGNITPKYIFIGLATNTQTEIKYLKSLYDGITDCAKKYSMTIAGGDSVRSNLLVLSITVVGMANKKSKILYRDGAKDGDLIGITNTFGDAACGLNLLFSKKKKFSKNEKFLIDKQNIPKARLDEAKIISKYANAMTDASDGLYTSIELITKSSLKGANINLELVPVSKQLKTVENNNKKILNYALFGGEDYELVFTVSKSKAKKLKQELDCVSYIGQINNSQKVRYFRNGKEEEIKYCGYKHF